jgi:hypothetical protein
MALMSDKMPENVALGLSLILNDGWRYRGAARYVGTTVDELHKWMRILVQEQKGKYAQKEPLDVNQ